MNLKKKIDDAILDIFPLMASSGNWPFTMMSIERSELAGSIGSHVQLLVLIKTDYQLDDLLDYLKNSKEYAFIPPDTQTAYLNSMVASIWHNQQVGEWSKKIASLAIGLICQLAKENNMCLTMNKVGFEDIHDCLEESQRPLSIYEVFEVFPMT